MMLEPETLGPAGVLPPGLPPPYQAPEDPVPGAPIPSLGGPPQQDKLAFVDFWPACLNAEEGFNNVVFERFDTLLPRANAWLRERPRFTVLKCETVEKRISSPEQLGNTNPKFDIPHADKNVYIILGLRLWYTSEIGLDTCLPSHPSQLGYRNFLPRCVDARPKNLVYDDLTDTYEDLNENIIDRPLEGRIITVESVSLRLVRPQWEGPDLLPDQTQWPEGPKYHILCMTRVFYLFECPAYEQIGAADFLPDFIQDEAPKSPASPKYSDFYSILVKVNQWLEKVKEVRIANIQTLEALFPGLGQAEKINTGANFTPKADTGPLIKFVRITYIRPKFGLPPGGLYVPRVITYKTFVPSVVGAGSDGSPEFEPISVLWSRVKAWLQQTQRRIVGMEMVHHPLPLLLKKKDEGESTVIKGMWIFPAQGSLTSEAMQRLATVELIRVYFDGQMFNPSLQPASLDTSHPAVVSPSPAHTIHTTQGSRSSSDSPILQHSRTHPHKQACNLL